MDLSSIDVIEVKLWISDSFPFRFESNSFSAANFDISALSFSIYSDVLTVFFTYFFISESVQSFCEYRISSLS